MTGKRVLEYMAKGWTLELDDLGDELYCARLSRNYKSIKIPLGVFKSLVKAKRINRVADPVRIGSSTYQGRTLDHWRLEYKAVA